VSNSASPVHGLSEIDHGSRLLRLQNAFDAEGLDGLLITDATHVRYLTGFAGSAGFMVVGADTAVLMTDDRYGDVARDIAASLNADLQVHVGGVASQRDATREFAASAARVGLEADDVSWAQAEIYRNEWFVDAETVATSGIVAALRLVKDPAEVERIERAAEMTDTALAEVRSMLGERVTERQLQLALDRAIIDNGADDLSFSTIVASGPNGARPHHVPGGRTIVEGDLVVIDVGALVDGYHSDMTRSFCVGEPDAASATMLDVVTAAQAAGVSAVTPGSSGESVDAAAREVIEHAGLGEEFVHGVGHGVGLLIHESPFLRGSDVPLVEGQVVTVEPGVYRSGFGGVRVEDTVVVTQSGCKPLTHSPKDPVVAVNCD